MVSKLYTVRGSQVEMFDGNQIISTSVTKDMYQHHVFTRQSKTSDIINTMLICQHDSSMLLNICVEFEEK